MSDRRSAAAVAWWTNEQLAEQWMRDEWTVAAFQIDHRQYVTETGSVANFPGAEQMPADQLLLLDVDVVIPAALGEVITKHNAGDIRGNY